MFVLVPRRAAETNTFNSNEQTLITISYCIFYSYLTGYIYKYMLLLLSLRGCFRCYYNYVYVDIVIFVCQKLIVDVRITQINRERH